MPKTTINDRYLVPNQLTGEGPQPDTINHLSVGWDKTGDVQAVIATASNPTGWLVHLDRAGCNRAIRALREARDTAYGKDA